MPSFFVLIYVGEVPCNHEIMRDALSLIQRLPVMKTDVFREDFYNVCSYHMIKRLLCILQMSTAITVAFTTDFFCNSFHSNVMMLC